ncbi:hypothetical protein EJ02DRAFT_226590 [Clathrospora elynae]|uniref:Uncharacterized protein n=1 Tax=Clathrospora elynae TaxID=706981 RepID=A0A6A5SLP9_9PLEO|nr:hypothetical protein EJ02DRAFT_226590 [Clathrospora elynae]
MTGRRIGRCVSLYGRRSKGEAYIYPNRLALPNTHFSTLSHSHTLHLFLLSVCDSLAAFTQANMEQSWSRSLTLLPNQKYLKSLNFSQATKRCTHFDVDLLPCTWQIGAGLGRPWYPSMSPFHVRHDTKTLVSIFFVVFSSLSFVRHSNGSGAPV